MNDIEYRRCDKCRWYTPNNGGECRYFDTDRDRVTYHRMAYRCPFYETRGKYIQDDEIIHALHRIAESVEDLTRELKDGEEDTVFCMGKILAVPSMGQEPEEEKSPTR